MVLQADFVRQIEQRIFVTRRSGLREAEDVALRDLIRAIQTEAKDVAIIRRYAANNLAGLADVDIAAFEGNEGAIDHVAAITADVVLEFIVITDPGQQLQGIDHFITIKVAGAQESGIDLLSCQSHGDRLFSYARQF